MKRVWFIVLPFLLIFASCPGTTPFDALEAAEILTETDRSFSGWNVSYDITTAFDFLEFFDAGGVSYTTTGLADASCPVYRLELVNLMTDGGFEAGTITWTPYGSPIADEIIPGVSPYDIDGDVFHYDFGTVSDYMDFDLDSLLLEFSAEGNYVLRFDMKSYSSNVAFEQRAPGKRGRNLVSDNFKYVTWFRYPLSYPGRVHRVCGQFFYQTCHGKLFHHRPDPGRQPHPGGLHRQPPGGPYKYRRRVGL